MEPATAAAAASSVILAALSKPQVAAIGGGGGGGGCHFSALLGEPGMFQTSAAVASRLAVGSQ